MTAARAQNPDGGQRRGLVLAAGLLVIWGLALWLYNGLFFKFARFFGLGAVSTAWTLAAFQIAYIAWALPAVLFHRRFGYKLGILAGLSVFGVSAFLLYLAIIQHSGLYFLGAVVVIGSCGAWLDTALAPLAIAAGKPETALRRLNIAYAFNGIGLVGGYSIAVMMLGKDYLLSAGATAEASAQPYVLIGLGAILLAFLMEQLNLPAFATKGEGRNDKHPVKAEIAALLHDRNFGQAALALSAYCVVLTILWTANYRYHAIEVPKHLVSFIERGWLWFAIGRLVFTLAMNWVAPRRLLLGCTFCALIAITLAATTGGETGWIALIAASLFLGITMPTIIGTALIAQPQRMALAAGLLVAAAGIGNALSSFGASLALDALMANPRLVVLAALPFELLVLYFALAANAGPKSACRPPDRAIAYG